MITLLHYLLIVLACLYIATQLVLVFSVAADKTVAATLGDDNLPTVSICVAARNEETNIAHCLNALLKLNYPIDKLEILVGNDQSQDRTAEIVADFCAAHTHVQLHPIETQLGKAKGKANVLAHLAHKSKGEFLFITDADVMVQPDWIKALLSQFDEHTAIVSGITVVKSRSLFGVMQQTDWLYFMGMMQGFENLGVHSTAVGNNMAITRKAYEQTGGYEAIDFSVTEDFKLYQTVRKLGWQTRNVLLAQALNFSAPLTDLPTLLHQRKRWLTGAKELPAYWWLIFALFGSFPIVVCGLLFINPQLALMCWVIKMGLQWISLRVLSRKLKLNELRYPILIYEFYSIFITVASLFYFIWPSAVKWKNRSY